ncbi:FAD-linked sulfhydryl oxidase ERV1 [Porphyridium purpureum]|uniref:Sulfhydryl oxidase n=1 Tax=Porphyridium purpureum TaxID=35688 RepID=A0A5J4YY22_PORPP|nr:FAD-linked sulfhydryl oxidase ERV1 [Porphyridium purpureum]|eukprot:POR3201..scf208_2
MRLSAQSARVVALTSAVWVLVLVVALYVAVASRSADCDSVNLTERHGAVSEATRKQVVGRAGWMLIHSMAAKFQPGEERAVLAMQGFLEAIAELYPCELCKTHFGQFLDASPPPMDSALALLVWTCKAHNEVNSRNGKQLFPCEKEPLQALYGDCGCDSS